MAIETLFIPAFIAGGSGAQKPDHRLRYIRERTARPVEGKFGGQGAAATHSGPQVYRATFKPKRSV